MRRSPSLTAFLPLLTAAALPITAAAAKPPNFVVILGEGHGWSSTSVPMDDAVPASKSAFVRTPNLEKLAQDGMRFANFYAPSPRCTPSRAALFTGKSPAQLHMTFIRPVPHPRGARAGQRAVTPGDRRWQSRLRPDPRR